jgi:hypothetical protein
LNKYSLDQRTAQRQGLKLSLGKHLFKEIAINYEETAFAIGLVLPTTLSGKSSPPRYGRAVAQLFPSIPQSFHSVFRLFLGIVRNITKTAISVSTGHYEFDLETRRGPTSSASRPPKPPPCHNQPRLSVVRPNAGGFNLWQGIFAICRFSHKHSWIITCPSWGPAWRRVAKESISSTEERP